MNNFLVTEKLDPEYEKKLSLFYKMCDNSHYRQNPQFSNLEKSMTNNIIWGILESNDQTILCYGKFIVRVIKIFKNIFLEAVCLRGPVFQKEVYLEEFIENAIKYCKGKCIGRICFSPYFFYPEAYSVQASMNKFNFKNTLESNQECTGLVDLKKSEEELLKSFTKNTKYELRQSSRLGVIITNRCSYEDAKTCFIKLNKMRRERDITLFNSDEFEYSYLKIYSIQNNGCLFVAYHNQEIIGSCWCVAGTKIANLVAYFVEHKSNLKVTIGVPLLWEVIKWAKSVGCEYVDLEGNVENYQKDNPLYNIAKFKRRFNPQSYFRISEQYCICNKCVYVIFKLFQFVKNFRNRSISITLGLIPRRLRSKVGV
jgi:lipid II:glycine glycyltransferase (peptidoglycan interpeptide bridge formation enzyme)